MFNGLIREIAEVISLSRNSLRIRAKFVPESIGDSVAINGACLSVTEIFKGGFEMEISSETKSKIAMQNLKGRVHIEPAMKLGDQIHGHLVQGHIDGVGKIAKINKLQSGFDFFVDLNSDLMPFVANKGSIAIDGVSLTVSEVLDNGVRVSIIPQTMKDTLFGKYKIGRAVNIETDLLARYAARILGFGNKNSVNLDKFGANLSEKTDKNELTWERVNLISSIY